MKLSFRATALPEGNSRLGRDLLKPDLRMCYEWQSRNADDTERN